MNFRLSKQQLLRVGEHLGGIHTNSPRLCPSSSRCQEMRPMWSPVSPASCTPDGTLTCPLCHPPNCCVLYSCTVMISGSPCTCLKSGSRCKDPRASAEALLFPSFTPVTGKLRAASFSGGKVSLSRECPSLLCDSCFFFSVSCLAASVAVCL